MIKPLVVLVLALASAPALATRAPRLDFVAPAAAPPPADDFTVACQKHRSAETCVCMTQRLLTSGAGQSAIEIDNLGRKYPRGIPDADYATLLAAHGLLPEQRKPLLKLSAQTVDDALGICR